MNKVRPVIVAVDLRDRGSRIALGEGHAAARRSGCELVVVHVLRSTHLAAPLFPQRYAEHLFDTPSHHVAAIDTMRGLVDELPRESAVEIRLKICEGNIPDQLVQFAVRANAQLIVVASAPHELGTTTSAVMHRSPCPVLVAREFDGRGPVIAATDLSDPSTPTIFTAAEMARVHAVELHAIHVVQPWVEPQVTLAETGVLVPYMVSEQVEAMAHHLSEHVARLGVSAVVHTPVGLPATEVARIARETCSRLLVIGTAGRSGLWRFFAGSVAEDLVRRAPCPVLVTPLQRRPAAAKDALVEATGWM